jgi:hypothetical protein
MEREKQPWWKNLTTKLKALKEKRSKKKVSTRMRALTSAPPAGMLMSGNALMSASGAASGIVSEVGLGVVSGGAIGVASGPTVNEGENQTEHENGDEVEEMTGEDELLGNIDTILWFQNRRLSRDFASGENRPRVFRFLDLPRELRDEVSLAPATAVA